MRHQRAAAGWPAGSGALAAADWTRLLVSRAERSKFSNLFVRLGRNESLIRFGNCSASSSAHC
jgi:hypothetical protein